MVKVYFLRVTNVNEWFNAWRKFSRSWKLRCIWPDLVKSPLAYAVSLFLESYKFEIIWIEYEIKLNNISYELNYTINEKDRYVWRLGDLLIISYHCWSIYIYIQYNNIIYILYIVICLPLKYVNMVHKFVERHKQIGIIIKSENSFRQIKLLSSIFALIFNF